MLIMMQRNASNAAAASSSPVKVGSAVADLQVSSSPSASPGLTLDVSQVDVVVRIRQRWSEEHSAQAREARSTWAELLARVVPVGLGLLALRDAGGRVVFSPKVDGFALKPR